MTNTIPSTPAAHAHADIQLSYLRALPRIRKHAQYALRHIDSRDVREELIAEAIALAWMHFLRLTLRGKKPEEFVATLALRCTQAVRSGRRLAGGEPSQDVLSPMAKARHGVSVVRLDDRVPALGADPVGPGGEIMAEALAIDPKARVPDQAALRIDFPEWRSRFGARDRAVLDALAAGERPGEVATRFALSPARVSQLREGFKASWLAFHQGEW